MYEQYKIEPGQRRIVFNKATLQKPRKRPLSVWYFIVIQTLLNIILAAAIFQIYPRG